MKVWVSRDNPTDRANKGIVDVYKTKEPPKFNDGDGFYRSDECFVLRLYAYEFKKHFGFTPRKGSCKQMELSLKEIAK